jgi:hypothetical protein
MKWQKARILKSQFPELIHREFYVKVERPRDRVAYFEGRVKGVTPDAVETNILSETDTHTYLWSLQMLELLPEFIEDAPLVSWEEFTQRAQ